MLPSDPDRLARWAATATPADLEALSADEVQRAITAIERLQARRRAERERRAARQDPQKWARQKWVQTRDIVDGLLEEALGRQGGTVQQRAQTVATVVELLDTIETRLQRQEDAGDTTARMDRLKAAARRSGLVS